LKENAKVENKNYWDDESAESWSLLYLIKSTCYTLFVVGLSVVAVLAVLCYILGEMCKGFKGIGKNQTR